MKNQVVSILVIFLLTSVGLSAQSYIGHTIDNYAGVHALTYNPAFVVDSRMRADVNLVSASSFLGSDYFGINVSNVLEAEDGFEFDSEVEKNPKDDNKFFLNADVLGPSFMFNLTPKSSIGVITRARAFFNVTNINGELYESLVDGFDMEQSFDFQNQDLAGTAHVWAEIGLVYGRILLDNRNNFLKAGATVKYLQGAGGLYVNSPQLQGTYNANLQTLSTSGSLSYGSTVDFDNDDIDFENLSSGFGIDLGLVYEWRPDGSVSLSRKQNKYKLKLGVSVTDLGSINYEESTTTTYLLDNFVDANEFEENDVETALEENYLGDETLEDVSIKLPTALNFLADYHMYKKFYLSLQGSLAMSDSSESLSNSIINTVTLSPRLETKWFSFYSPISLRQYDGLAWGAGFRLGTLTVGSGSILTNLIAQETKTTDIYVGLKVPIYQ